MRKIETQSAIIGGAIVAASVAVFKLGQYLVAKSKEKKVISKTSVVEKHKDINPAADVVVETKTETTKTETQTA